MNSDQPDPPSPVTETLEHELDNFINLQQQLLNTKILKFHHILHPNSSAESSNQKPTAVETRAHRVFKRKHPLLNPTYFTTPFFSFRTLHTKTKESLKHKLPFFPQYTYYENSNDHQRNFVDDYNLFPNLSWNITTTSIIHFHSLLSLIQATMIDVNPSYTK